MLKRSSLAAVHSKRVQSAVHRPLKKRRDGFLAASSMSVGVLHSRLGKRDTSPYSLAELSAVWLEAGGADIERGWGSIKRLLLSHSLAPSLEPEYKLRAWPMVQASPAAHRCKFDAAQICFHRPRHTNLLSTYSFSRLRTH